MERKNFEYNSDLYEPFCECETNIPCFDAMKQVSHYAKFMKEVFIAKKKKTMKSGEKIKGGKNVSALIQKNLHANFKDPGTFSIPCMIGDTRIEKAMLDSEHLLISFIFYVCLLNMDF